MVSALRAPWLDPLMLGISAAGLYGAVFLAMGGAVTAMRRGWTVMALWRLVLAAALAQVVAVSVLKPLLPAPAAVGGGRRRSRPSSAQPSQDSSMPSGHAATAVAGAIALDLAVAGGRVLAWALALAIVCSRLYLGVHYPSDIVVGALVGWACAMVATVRMPAAAAPSVRAATIDRTV